MTTVRARSHRQTRLIRSIWLLVAAGVTTATTIGLAIQWTKLQTVCRPPACRNFQLDAAAAHTLSTHGVSPFGLAIYVAVVGAIVWVIWYGLSALIIWRKPDERGPVMAAFFLAIYPGWALSTWVANVGLQALVSFSGIGLLLLFALFFPDGIIRPHWGRWIALAAVPAYTALSLVGMFVIPVLLTIAAAIVVQVIRFRSHSSWAQRQQTKWALGGFVLTTVCITVIGTFHGHRGELFAAIASPTLFEIASTTIPVTIAISLLRNRLWDVDRVISRALVYLSLTATLAGIYVGSVIGLQAIFRAVTGQQSDVAIAISTLGIAALFNPLRHRLQDLIARTFYRQRYDASKVLASFGEACRDETDLETLQADLVRVVQEAVQPGYVSLWLRDLTQ